MANKSQLPGIEVLAVDSIEQLADLLPCHHKYFTLLLAWDAPDITQDSLIELFRPLADRGLAYFCAWGKRCSEIHDAVDLCVVETEISVGQKNYLLMTTWHADEPLEEALWFFKMNAIPAECHVFADFDRFAVAVGNPEWANRMKHALSAQGDDIAEAV